MDGTLYTQGGGISDGGEAEVELMERLTDIFCFAPCLRCLSFSCVCVCVCVLCYLSAPFRRILRPLPAVGRAVRPFRCVKSFCLSVRPAQSTGSGCLSVPFSQSIRPPRSVDVFVRPLHSTGLVCLSVQSVGQEGCLSVLSSPSACLSVRRSSQWSLSDCLSARVGRSGKLCVPRFDIAAPSRLLDCDLRLPSSRSPDISDVFLLPVFFLWQN